MPQPDIRPMLLKDRRIICIYIERCIIHQNRLALTFTDEEGRKEIPAGQIATLFLGYGTSITSDAIRLCAEQNVTIIWVAGGVTTYYAHGNPITKNGSITNRQSLLHSSSIERNRVAREMFSMRFPDVPANELRKLSFEQLRSKEGTRVRKAYQETASKYGLTWQKRITRIQDIPEDDVLNKAITIGTANLYGLTHSIIIAIGANPTLGFIHEGHILSFVYDITDLYKTELVLPTVFKLIAEHKNLLSEKELITNLDKLIRPRMREMFHEQKLVTRIITDIKRLLTIPDEELFSPEDLLFLWGKEEIVSAGRNWE